MAIRLALIGGGEWTEGCEFDQQLLSDSGSDRVVVVPTAAAYENAAGVVERARAWFGAFGAVVDVVDVYRRSEALDPSNSAVLEDARFVYLAGGSPMHLRSVLKDTPLWQRIRGVCERGGVLAGSGEGATVLCSHMVDSRGGAYTLGLELLSTLTVIPRHNRWSEDKLHRTVQLAQKDLAVLGIDERTAVMWDGVGWSVAGVGSASVFRNGSRAQLADLGSPFETVSATAGQ